jgi:hypothetical protein
VFLAVTDVEVPNGVFRWGTSNELSVLATWHSNGLYFFPDNEKKDLNWISFRLSK